MDSIVYYGKIEHLVRLILSTLSVEVEQYVRLKLNISSAGIEQFLY